MLALNRAWRFRLAAVVTASVLLHVGCGDDGVAPTGAGGADDSGGASSAGGDGSAGQDRDAAGASAGGGDSAAGGQGGNGRGGDGLSGHAGDRTQGSGGAEPTTGGAAGGAAEPCAGELLDGQCFAPFALVQSNVSATGSGASSSSVKLASALSSGSTLLLAVGIIWQGTAKTITVPAGFTLVERRDNAVGASSHESAVFYLAESAAVVPALSEAVVTVDDAQARLYLALAEYAGLKASGVVDQKASQAGTSMASPGTTAQTASNQELWVVATMSRGGVDHTAPTENFAFIQATKTGAGSFSLMQKLVSQRGLATTSLTSSGDYASVIATLRR